MITTTTTSTTTVRAGALANVAPNVKRIALAGILAVVILSNAACQKVDTLRHDAASHIECGQYADRDNPYNLPGVQSGAGEVTGCDALRDIVAGK